MKTSSQERTTLGRSPEPHERLAAAWAGARDGLWDWDLEREEIRFSPRWREALGYTDKDFPDRIEEWFRRVHPRDLDALKRAIAATAAGDKVALEHEFRMLHRDGSWRRFLVHGKKLHDRELLGGSFTDITAEKRTQDQLLHELFHDPMTGLPNKALFLDRLELALSRRGRRGGPPLAILYLDLDRFHNVNDSLGVDAGDKLLAEVAERLKARLRPGDTLARLGGDKFGILLDGVHYPREAMRFADAARTELGKPIHMDGHELCLQASFGIALSSRASERSADILRDAITAMHRAKEDGATPYEVFDPEMNSRAKDRLRLEGDLRRALHGNGAGGKGAGQEDEFLLHYQPIISLETGEIAAFEALVRWQHPTRGLVRPDAFVPIAEDTGLILPLGSWVLKEACRQLVRWRTEHPAGHGVTVAINLSAHQFREPGLVDSVASELADAGLSPNLLELEVTESVLMERTQENTRTLHELRDLGVRLSIDDFGTGYSSLACLHSFPLDQLKVDRSFVMRMEFEAEKVAIVKTVLALARTLGLEVVAEGIETAEALAMLRDFQCAKGQGFYFSNAIEGRAAQAMLENPPIW